MHILRLLKRTISLLIIGLAVLPAKAQDKAKVLHELNTLLINTVMVDFFYSPCCQPYLCSPQSCIL